MVAVEREDFDRLSTLAKKYVTAEKKESKLQKAVDAANKLIAKLKAEIDSLKQEISDYKSVHSKLRAAELERENTERDAAGRQAKQRKSAAFMEKTHDGKIIVLDKFTWHWYNNDKKTWKGAFLFNE